MGKDCPASGPLRNLSETKSGGSLFCCMNSLLICKKILQPPREPPRRTSRGEICQCDRIGGQLRCYSDKGGICRLRFRFSVESPTVASELASDAVALTD